MKEVLCQLLKCSTTFDCWDVPAIAECSIGFDGYKFWVGSIKFDDRARSNSIERSGLIEFDYRTFDCVRRGFWRHFTNASEMRAANLDSWGPRQTTIKHKFFGQVSHFHTSLVHFRVCFSFLRGGGWGGRGGMGGRLFEVGRLLTAFPTLSSPTNWMEDRTGIPSSMWAVIDRQRVTAFVRVYIYT